MAWIDPMAPQPQPQQDSQTQQPPPLPSGMGLPPMSSYGALQPAWNKEMMDLLVDIEIPDEYMQGELMQRIFVWTKKILMQMQFGNYTASIQKKLIKDLQFIIFLGAQDGNDGVVAEAQLIFVANLMIYKGRSDMPDGIRERIAWIMGINKNVFSDERVPKPVEHKGILGLPWGGK
jgi:hypothetical protein